MAICVHRSQKMANDAVQKVSKRSLEYTMYWDICPDCWVGSHLSPSPSPGVHSHYRCLFLGAVPFYIKRHLILGMGVQGLAMFGSYFAYPWHEPVQQSEKSSCWFQYGYSTHTHATKKKTHLIKCMMLLGWLAYICNKNNQPWQSCHFTPIMHIQMQSKRYVHTHMYIYTYIQK